MHNDLFYEKLNAFDFGCSDIDEEEYEEDEWREDESIAEYRARCPRKGHL